MVALLFQQVLQNTSHKCTSHKSDPSGRSVPVVQNEIITTVIVNKFTRTA